MRSVVMFPDTAVKDVLVVINVPDDLTDIETVNDYIAEKLDIFYGASEFKCFDCPRDFPISDFLANLRNEVKDDA